MKSIPSSIQYGDYKKPKWAPPSWVFGPVWTLLYVLILISFGYVALLFSEGRIAFLGLLPFALNLIFNLLYTFIQFRLRNFLLAALDVMLVLVTLLWAMVALFPVAHWVVYVNIPYLVWVCFASILQINVTLLNKK